MTNHAELRLQKDRVEREYDALITQLNRCQQQLSAKADQARKLNPEAYREWLAAKKAEVADIQAQVAAKKEERAEARRQFTGWQPPAREEWIDWPDEEGWWWFWNPEHSDELRIFHCIEDDDGAICPGGAPRIAIPDGLWRYQEEPERP